MSSNSNKFEQSESKEASREDLLAKFLTDESLCDIALEGSDGVRVPANRCILSARSEVFHNMLLGGFSEASKKIILIGYEGNVLKAVVEYILTDSATLLSDGAEGEATAEAINRIRALVSLTGAALYFNLPLLSEKAFQAISNSIKNTPGLALPALQAYNEERPGDPSIKALAMAVLSFRSLDEVDPAAISILSPSVLEDILIDKECPLDEYRLFELLRIWADEQSAAAPERRRSIAADLIQHIHLEWIDPNLLCTTVATSGLVPQELLMETFKKQALAAHAKDDRIFKRARFRPVWKGSRTEVATSKDMEGDVLDYPPMTSGVHQWTIEVEKEACATWLGVALTTAKLDLGSWLGRQEGVWLLGSNGGKANAKGEILPPKPLPNFSHCSRVTFTLNLSEGQQDGGTLSAAVNGGDSFLVFSGLRKQMESQDAGFVPAVSRPRRVRLLEITKLRN